MFYYYTGLGGPILLASVMVPYAFFLNTLESYLRGELYPRLRPTWVRVILAAYGLIAFTVACYIAIEFYELVTVRAGSYTLADVVVGFLAFAIVMEYARRRHLPLFALNVFLVFYAVFGFLFPGLLWHPGIRVERVITAMSVEFETGVFERLPQLALTLIGAFILFIGVAQGFGLVESVVKVVSSAMGRSPRLIPQAAVLGSMAVASVSGSGAANAATTGTITIPLMKRVGFAPHVAASVETAASLGGQLMPPIMGISAFIMADFLGRSYFDVVARGYMPALVYYGGVALAVYMLSARFLKGGVGAVELGRPTVFDYARLALFLAGVASLIVLMGVYTVAPMYAALLSAFGLLVAATILTIVEGRRPRQAASLLASRLARTVVAFTSFVADLTLLLSTLAIMTGLLTITGLPVKIGFVMMDIGAGNLPLLAAIAFVFGYLVGLGLPPAATYIITALIIVPYLVEAGVNPWVAHFYAFMLGVFSELSPPTSVTAAVASRIAGASFMLTMIYATAVCVPLLVLMPSLFIYPGLVVEPGPGQLVAALPVLAATAAIAAATWAKLPLALRLAYGCAGFVTLLSPIVGLDPLGLSLATLAASIYAAYRSRER
jgi:TRAP transporter 4TM/12TM fusion protein